MRFAAVAGLLLLTACDDKGAPPGTSTATSPESAPPAAPTASSTQAAPTSSAPAPAPPVPALKPMVPEESPPLAALASEVPEIEKRVTGIDNIWEASERARLRVLLTILSQLISSDGALTGEALNQSKLAEYAPLKDVAAALFTIDARTNAFPKAFDAALEKHLDAVAGEKNLGVWGAAEGTALAWDYSGLAAWRRRNDPRYIRAMQDAREDGPVKWAHIYFETNSRRGALQQPFSAMALLRRATESLTEKDLARLKRILNPNVGDAIYHDIWELRITKVYATRQTGGLAPHKAADGSTLIVVEYDARNLTKEPAAMRTELWLTDASARVFTGSREAKIALAFAGESKALTMAQPGVATKMATAFEVPVTLESATVSVRIPLTEPMKEPAYRLDVKLGAK